MPGCFREFCQLPLRLPVVHYRPGCPGIIRCPFAGNTATVRPGRLCHLPLLPGIAIRCAARSRGPVPHSRPWDRPLIKGGSTPVFPHKAWGSGISSCLTAGSRPGLPCSPAAKLRQAPALRKRPWLHSGICQGWPLPTVIAHCGRSPCFRSLLPVPCCSCNVPVSLQILRHIAHGPGKRPYCRKAHILALQFLRHKKQGHAAAGNSSPAYLLCAHGAGNVCKRRSVPEDSCQTGLPA